MDASIIDLSNEIAALVIKQLAEKPVMPRVWFDHKEAATYTRRSPRSLEQANAEGVGPKMHRASGGKRLYHIADLDNWIRGVAS